MQKRPLMPATVPGQLAAATPGRLTDPDFKYVMRVHTDIRATFERARQAQAAQADAARQAAAAAEKRARREARQRRAAARVIDLGMVGAA